MKLRVTKAVGLVTVQDLGRVGWMHAAVPVGGALVRGMLRDANRAAGTAAGAAGVEVCGVLRVRAEGGAIVVADGVRVMELEDGEELEVASGRDCRVAYLAVRGGVDAPLRMGSRGTLLCAGMGSVLRAGDVIEVGSQSGNGDGDGDGDGDRDGDGVRVVIGPDDEAFEDVRALLQTSYRIRPDSDRVGTRLDGVIARRAGYVETTRPLVRGAIEVPGDGRPIVLGPEHPVTGGYPVVAVVVDDDLDKLFAMPIGARVRFVG